MKRLALSLAALLASSSSLLAQGYPPGAAPIVVSANGTTTAITATLVATPSLTVYLCGFSIRALATGATNGLATISGITGGTMSFAQWVAPLASGIGNTDVQTFNPCIPGVYNTNVVITTIAPGAGGQISVNAWGYLK